MSLLLLASLDEYTVWPIVCKVSLDRLAWRQNVSAILSSMNDNPRERERSYEPDVTFSFVESADELAEVGDLSVRSFRDAFGDQISPEALEPFLIENRSKVYFEKALARGDKLVVARLLDGTIVAYALYGAVQITDARDATSDDREFQRLYVDTERQQHGIGSQLFAHVLDLPDMRQAPRVYLQVWQQNERAIALYERYGFTICGTTTYDMPDGPDDDFIMVRAQHP